MTEMTKMNSVKDFLKKLWALTYPYWFSEERWIARVLLFAIVSLNLGIVFINVQLNKWNAVFYNALQDKDINAFWVQLGFFCILATFYIVMAVYQLYLNQMLQIRWRRWLTDKHFDRWFENQVYYRLELKGKDTDNPDQRIAQDLQAFTSDTLSYVIGLLSAVVTLVSFVAILWGLSGDLTLPGFGGALKIPGYMVWVALIYSVLGTWLTHKIGHPLVKLNFDLEKHQAHFRYNLVRFRENAEAIALYHGEKDEKRNLLEKFQGIWETWWSLMKRQKQLTWFTSTYGQLAVIFPLLVAAPRYFAGAIQLGGLVQTALAFGQVQASLSWFVTAYSGLAGWKASVDRLTSFRDALQKAQEESTSEKEILFHAPSSEGFSFKDLSLKTPAGNNLIENAQAKIEKRDRVLVTGASGCGKSTLFRALAGIWPFAQGKVSIPTEKILFLPQKPYLPIDSLRAVLSYPAGQGTFSDERIKQALSDGQLSHLANNLDQTQNWSMALSPGEQQRVAFARAYLQQPQWLLLDEATASVDEKTEALLYDKLIEKNPDATLVSIGHRPSLTRFHTKQLHFDQSSDRTQLVLSSL